MDESAPMRAIMIGASVFVTIATITGVLAYYSTSKDLVNAIGTGTDIGQEYANYIENILLKTDNTVEIKGTDVINLLNYFYRDEKAQINVTYIRQDHSFESYTNVDATNKNVVVKSSRTNLDEKSYNQALQFIVPTQKFTMTKSVNNEDVLLVEIVYKI
ncbi:MAG: hypothetical protein PHP54_03460 [Clostridia bacterium]|nr:hypothetical protein [Clostridia bacterium]